jgi:asparagine synthase (glutamine-hydrolysing)
MCGIAGIFSRSQIASGDRQVLKRMADVMVHRGPDGEGFYYDAHVGLAHRRLSIIDLEGGKQPLSNEDGTVWVTFNGEIYNYLELRELLLQKGHKFTTSSDTEVIVHLYEEKGDDFLTDLRGMFAIGLWDARKRRLLLARDRVGKKPLFYATLSNRIVFASELKSLLQVPGVSKDIEPEALVDYFSLLYVPAPKSIYRQVRKVRPASFVVFDSQGMCERSYWDIHFDAPETKRESDWCEELLQVYQEAIRMRLRSDVPLGAFLSGGVDSSSVVALMSRMNDRPVNTCSVGFDEKEFDESPEAAAFARRLGTEHHEERVRPDALSVLDRLAWFFDEPFADSSAIPTFYVSQAARRHVTVALSGDGGDENFAGYRRYYHDLVENRCRSYIPDGIRGPVFGALGRWYPKLDWAPRMLRAQATFRAFARSPVEGYFFSVSAIKPETLATLFTADFMESVGGYSPVGLFEDLYNRPVDADHLSRLQYLDIKTYLVDDILVKVDRASMAVSLEVRCPLLDHKFMELIARIPSSLKLKGSQGKYIFKQALGAVLPSEVLTRRKQGFAVPLAAWFRRDLKELASDILLSPDRLGVLRSDSVAAMWKHHQSGLSDQSTPLWTILMYRLWQEKFLRGTLSEAAPTNRLFAAN